MTAGGTSLCVWDMLAGGRLLQRLSQHQKTVTCVALSPLAGPDSAAAPRMLSGSLDGHVKVCMLAIAVASWCLGEDWCSTACWCMTMLHAPPHFAKVCTVHCFLLFPLACLTDWRLDSMLRLGEHNAMHHNPFVLVASAYQDDMSCMHVAEKCRSQQHMVQVYDLDTFKVTHASKYPGPVTSLGISPDCGLLAVGQADGQLSIRKHSKPKLVPVEAGEPPCTTWPLKCAPSHRVIMSACCLPRWCTTLVYHIGHCKQP